MKKKLLFIFIPIIVVLILLLIIFLSLFAFKKYKQSIPYVVKKDIEIISPNKTYNSGIDPYTLGEDGYVMEIDGVSFDKTEATYKFYDYEVSKEDKDGNVIHNFMINIDAPIVLIYDAKKDLPKYRYSYTFNQIHMFDYYSGDVYKIKHSSDEVRHYDFSETDDDMKYTTIKWNNKKYKIGVRIDSIASWDNADTSNDGNRVYTLKNANHITSKVSVKAPKDFDGIMFYLKKNGPTHESVLKDDEKKKKHIELKDKYKETGKKSKELIKIENESKKVYKLLESSGSDEERDKNDFYVFKISDIKKKGK